MPRAVDSISTIVRGARGTTCSTVPSDLAAFSGGHSASSDRCRMVEPLPAPADAWVTVRSQLIRPGRFFLSARFLVGLENSSTLPARLTPRIGAKASGRFS
jgi:hypothetical protein